jgi:hypothetical protein
MANACQTGPLGFTVGAPIDAGTMCLTASPRPGPVGSSQGGAGADGRVQHTGRAFLFILADEILPSGKVIRKVMVAPDGMASEAFVRNPEVFGFGPRSPGAAVSIGEHALGNNKSPYISASTKAGGAPNFNGTSYYIDIAKAKAAGVRFYSTDEIIADLKRLATEQPNLRYRVDKLIGVIKDLEGEVLLEGKVPASAVKSPLSMNITRGLRGLQFIGIVLTAHDLAVASQKSMQQHSAAPLAAEGLRQVGGWGGALAGMKIGGIAGAAVGIESGPGALVTGAVGALIFGSAGYFGADWLAKWTLD